MNNLTIYSSRTFNVMIKMLLLFHEIDEIFLAQKNYFKLLRDYSFQTQSIEIIIS